MQITSLLRAKDVTVGVTGWQQTHPRGVARDTARVSRRAIQWCALHVNAPGGSAVPCRAAGRGVHRRHFLPPPAANPAQMIGMHE
jgi:hypothetical protein